MALFEGKAGEGRVGRPMTGVFEIRHIPMTRDY